MIINNIPFWLFMPDKGLFTFWSCNTKEQEINEPYSTMHSGWLKIFPHAFKGYISAFMQGTLIIGIYTWPNGTIMHNGVMVSETYQE